MDKVVTLSTAPLSDAKCIFCEESLDDCACTFDNKAPSIFFDNQFDLFSDDLLEE